MSEPDAPTGTIGLLDSNFARVYTHIHPFLVTALYAYKLPAIVQEPLRGLLQTLPWLAILQTAFVVTCLPASGSTRPEAEARKPSSGRSKKPTTKRAGGGISLGSARLPEILYTGLWMLTSMLFAMPAIAGVLILLGAPVTDKVDLTILCASHMALLTGVPAFYTHGLDLGKAKEVLGMMRPLDEVHGGLYGTLVGAWLGAVPIPLDWDRDWQKYPITIVAGAYAGYALGVLLGGTLLHGKRIRFEAKV